MNNETLATLEELKEAVKNLIEENEEILFDNDTNQAEVEASPIRDFNDTDVFEKIRLYQNGKLDALNEFLEYLNIIQ